MQMRACLFQWLQSSPGSSGQIRIPSRDSFYPNGLTWIPAWMRNHMPTQIWDEITYPLSNINDCTIKVWELISSFTQHYIMDVIIHPCWDLKLIHACKRGCRRLMLYWGVCGNFYPIYRADSRLAPSQWKTLLQSNAVSYWPVENLEPALNIHLHTQDPCLAILVSAVVLCQATSSHSVNCTVNSSSPGHNGRHFAENIFKSISFNEKAWIMIKISLKFLNNFID